MTRISLFVLLVLLIAGCNALMKHENPQDVSCTASCDECKNVALVCHKIGKSEDSESVSVSN
jgi:hypothetical protein